MSNLVVGVDGGGSSTRVLVANESGEVIAHAEGTGSTMSPGRAEHSSGVIVPLIKSALESLGENAERPSLVYAGIAGTGREEERRALEEELRNSDVADDAMVTTDAEIALYDAFGDGPGILLIAGTGSIAFGRGPTGVLARCGGWGTTFGDEGSGAWIGRRALSAVAAASDGREPETALTGAILTACQVNEPDELIPWALAADTAAFAALAPIVVAAAVAGDQRASSLINIAVEELVLHVRALAKQLFVDERAAYGVALAGGLLHKRSLMRKRIDQRLKVAVPSAQVRADEVNAGRGAVKAALKQTVGV